MSWKPDRKEREREKACHDGVNITDVALACQAKLNHRPFTDLGGAKITLLILCNHFLDV